MPQPLVSVCCITYNHASYIKECLEGIMMQNCDFDFEVLIHDDASEDETQKILKEFQQLYPETIKIYLQTENQYSLGIRNIQYKFNFSRAKGKYIALCEGDDYWTDPFKLQKQVKFMEANSDIVFSYHKAKTINSIGEFGNYFYFSDRHLGIIPKEIFISKGGGGYATASCMFLTSMFDKFPSYFTIGAPGDFCLALLAISKGKIGYMEDYMSVYRLMSVGSWSSNTSKEFKLKNNQLVNLTLENFHHQTNNKFRRVTKKLYSYLKYYELIYLSEGENRYRKLKFLAQYSKIIGFENSLKYLKNNFL